MAVKKKAKKKVATKKKAPAVKRKATKKKAAKKKSKRTSDRATVAAGQAYEVAYFAKKVGVTPAEVKAAIKTVGNNRAKLTAHFKK
jgi:hypothetical protein